MKKLISILLTLTLALALGAPVLAAAADPDGAAGETAVEDVPGSVSMQVLLSATGIGRYADDVTDGAADVTGPGFEAHAPGGIPAGAVKLVVVPITDPETLAWYSGCVGEHWTDTGVIYAVFYEDAAGGRLPAPGVQLTLTAPGGYDDLNVFAVSEAGGAASLDYTGSGALTFTTNGSLYYGAAHRLGVLEGSTQVGPGAPSASLDMTDDELAEAVVTDADREYMAEGVDVNVMLTVEDANDTVTPAEVSAVESVAGDYTIGGYIEVELLKQVGDQPWESIHETSSPIRITIQIPENMLGHAEYAIVRIHGDTATFLPDLDSDPATITFETSQFSTYAILFRDPAPTATPKPTATPAPTKQPGEAPPTGDDTSVAPWAMLLAASAAGLAAVLVRKKKSDRSYP